jgi:mycofactocin system creatininase family protein
LQTLQELGEAVAARRKQLGLKQGDVAAMAGVTAESLSRFERGRIAEFGTRKLLAVLAALGLELDVVRQGQSGNLDALRTAVQLLRAEGRDAGWCSCSVAGADAHAGHTETSVLLHLSPEVVCTQDMAPGNTEPLADLLPRLRDGGVAAVSTSGVLGDPTTATATEGERIIADMVTDCVARVQRWTPGPDGMLT